MSMFKALIEHIKSSFMYDEAYAVLYYTPKLKKESIVSAFKSKERALKEKEYVKKLSAKRFKGEYKVFKIAYILNIYNYHKLEEIE